MSMEKYATYKVFKHKTTGEIKRIAVEDSEELAKFATNETSDWLELDADPDNG